MLIIKYFANISDVEVEIEEKLITREGTPTQSPYEYSLFASMSVSLSACHCKRVQMK